MRGGEEVPPFHPRALPASLVTDEVCACVRAPIRHSHRPKSPSSLVSQEPSIRRPEGVSLALGSAGDSDPLPGRQVHDVDVLIPVNVVREGDVAPVGRKRRKALTRVHRRSQGDELARAQGHDDAGGCLVAVLTDSRKQLTVRGPVPRAEPGVLEHVRRLHRT